MFVNGISNGDRCRRARWVIVSMDLLALILVQVAAPEAGAIGVTLMVLVSLVSLAVFALIFDWDEMDRTQLLVSEIFALAAFSSAAYYAIFIALPGVWAYVAELVVMGVAYVAYWAFTWRRDSER